jgi:hypothetical protein
MLWVVVPSLAACGALLLVWTLVAVVEARVNGSRMRRVCTAAQLAFFGALLATTLVMLVVGAQTGQRWAALLLIAVPFLVVLLWASVQLRRIS